MFAVGWNQCKAWHWGLQCIWTPLEDLKWCCVSPVQWLSINLPTTKISHIALTELDALLCKYSWCAGWKCLFLQLTCFYFAFLHVLRELMVWKCVIFFSWCCVWVCAFLITLQEPSHRDLERLSDTLGCMIICHVELDYFGEEIVDFYFFFPYWFLCWAFYFGQENWMEKISTRKCLSVSPKLTDG